MRRTLRRHDRERPGRRRRTRCVAGDVVRPARQPPCRYPSAEGRTPPGPPGWAIAAPPARRARPRTWLPVRSGSRPSLLGARAPRRALPHPRRRAGRRTGRLRSTGPTRCRHAAAQAPSSPPRPGCRPPPRAPARTRSLTPATYAQHAAGRTWRVSANGFWQVHEAAADTLVEAVMTGLEPRRGDTAWDLYCGVGLFAGPLVDAGVAVRGVELSRRAVRDASRNVPEARFEAGRVEQVARRWPNRVDLVVCDPPRTGIGKVVAEQVVRRRPRRIAYVACDPAALGRDVATFAASGYSVRSLRAFDIFPMTHHVECVAILEG